MINYETKIHKINYKLIEEEKLELLKKESVLEEAVELLKKGELVAFPTETVYGLGADATNPEAVKKIYLAKGRPQDNPLIVHIANLQQLAEITKGKLNNTAKKLISAFWPGPLTIVVKKNDIIPAQTTANLDSVAIRMPSHPLIRALIELTGIPIAAPSANKSGAPSPTRAVHVYSDLYGRIPLIIDGGTAEVGVESTVVDIRDDIAKILRPGGISREEIRKEIGMKLYKPGLNSGQAGLKVIEEAKPPVSPGMKYRHYSPETPLYIIEGEDIPVSIIQNQDISANNIALILSDETYSKYCSELQDIMVIKMGPQKNPEIIAANIFNLLRRLDELSLNCAYIEAISEKGIGEAVMNRIRKASSRE